MNIPRLWNYAGKQGRAIDIGTLTFYYSYSTLVAFRSKKQGLVVRKNEWGTVTGLHLNEVDRHNKGNRVDCKEFLKKLYEVLKTNRIEESP